MGSFSSKYLKDIWNLPNILTMLRLVLIPVFAGLFLAGYEKWALAVFIIASITDYLDGYLARKNNQITAFGKLMDPLADKLMVCTALLGQGLSGVFPWPAILIVMTKEVVMIIGGIYMLQNGIVVYSNILGKAAQFSFIAALILSFWHKEFVAASLPLDRIILWIAVALALVALVDYALDAAKKLESEYGISAEVIDARSMVPFNYEKVIESVKKTGKIVIVGDAVDRGSIMRDMASNITEMCFDYLDAPPAVFGSRNWITPAFELEKYYFPQADGIIDVISEKLMPIPGHVTKYNETELEHIERAKKGV